MTAGDTAPTTPADIARQHLRRELGAAIKRRQPTQVSVLRTAIAAIDNAEVPDEGQWDNASEIPRRLLSHRDVLAVLTSQIEEHKQAAALYRSNGHQQRAENLEEYATMLRSQMNFLDAPSPEQ